MHVPEELRSLRPSGSQSQRLDAEVRTYWGEQAWTCQLCGNPIPLDAPRGSDWAWSKDHILSIAQGGGNDLANLQPAHSVCNKRKATGNKRKNARGNGRSAFNRSREW